MNAKKNSSQITRVVLPPLDPLFSKPEPQHTIPRNTPKGNSDGKDGNLPIPPHIRTVHITPLDLSSHYLYSSFFTISRNHPSLPSLDFQKGAVGPPEAAFSRENESPFTVSRGPAGDTQITQISGKIGQVISHSVSPFGSTTSPLVGLYEVVSDASGVLGFIRRLPGDLTRIALDIETFALGGLAHEPLKGDPRKGSAVDWQAARIRLISLTVAGHDPVVIDLGVEREAAGPLRQAVETLLNRLQRVEIVGHRLGFDLCFLFNEFGWLPSKVWDTWVAEELLLNDDWELYDKVLRQKKKSPGPTALENALKRRCAIALNKGLGGGALSDFGAPLLSEEQYAYSAGDTRYLFALEDKQWPEIAAAGMNRIAEIEMALVPVMSRLELVGIPMRADILIQSLADLRASVSKIDLEILPAMQAMGFDPYLDYSPVSNTYLCPSKKVKPVNVNGDNLRQHYFKAIAKRLAITMPRTKAGKMSLTLEVLRSIEERFVWRKLEPSLTLCENQLYNDRLREILT